jgi:hypothetical protein
MVCACEHDQRVGHDLLHDHLAVPRRGRKNIKIVRVVAEARQQRLALVDLQRNVDSGVLVAERCQHARGEVAAGRADGQAQAA